MPTFQSEQFIDAAVRSVLAQSVPDLELLIADDGSTDKTTEIIGLWQQRDNRVQLVSNQRLGGPGPARNAAISHARGSFIAFLDSDDVWFSEKLAVQLQSMSRTSAGLSYTGYRRIDEMDRPLSIVRPPDSVTRERLLRSNVIACSTVIYDRRRLGLRFMPELARGQDYAMWLELLRSGAASGVPEPLALYRVRSESVSSNKWKSANSIWDVYREAGVTSRVRSSWYFAHYAVHGVKRRLRELRRYP